MGRLGQTRRAYGQCRVRYGGQSRAHPRCASHAHGVTHRLLPRILVSPRQHQAIAIERHPIGQQDHGVGTAYNMKDGERDTISGQLHASAIKLGGETDDCLAILRKFYIFRD
jgi:hypothetical protein